MAARSRRTGGASEKIVDGKKERRMAAVADLDYSHWAPGTSRSAPVASSFSALDDSADSSEERGTLLKSERRLRTKPGSRFLDERRKLSNRSLLGLSKAALIITLGLLVVTFVSVRFLMCLKEASPVFGARSHRGIPGPGGGGAKSIASARRLGEATDDAGPSDALLQGPPPPYAAGGEAVQPWGSPTSLNPPPRIRLSERLRPTPLTTLPPFPGTASLVLHVSMDPV